MDIEQEYLTQLDKWCICHLNSSDIVEKIGLSANVGLEHLFILSSRSSYAIITLSALRSTTNLQFMQIVTLAAPLNHRCVLIATFFTNSKAICFCCHIK
jgi:hypothetical protein